jgi:selenocysteine lyase/cysteine desulfurase
MKRRNFLKNSALLAISPSLVKASGRINTITLEENLAALNRQPKQIAASMNDEWDRIAMLYDVSSDFINLENGYCSMLPVPVLESFIQKTKDLNRKLTLFMRKEMETERQAIKNNLADIAGVPTSEIALVRNTTEGMNIVIHGIDLKAGDEIILSKQDYGSMIDAFEQKAKRTGSVNKYINIPLAPLSKQAIIDAYAKAITPKTKLILVSHIINITGQIMPVREICDMAHARGVEVIVDGAHSFGLIDFRITDLDCDYFATSLHKWFGAPIGAGLLHMKTSKIGKVWPLLGDTGKDRNSIEKFEHIGTNPPAVYLSARAAIEFNLLMGIKLKEERLRYLKNYWVDKVKDIPKVKMFTPAANQSCAIATFAIDGMPPAEIEQLLLNQHRIFTVAINNDEVSGVRVTPHVFTSVGQLDKLVEAIRAFVEGKFGPIPEPGAKPTMPAPVKSGKGKKK